ncbi:MAG: glutamine synthetase [Legionellales bacterium]|nr:glutamine synthetase [Legionellales bacterium]
MISKVTYIWIDGTIPYAKLRSKVKVLSLPESDVKLSDLPLWGFDGSSTNQAPTHQSDLVLKPVCIKPNPLEDYGSYLALCEVLDTDHKPVATNHRAKLIELMEQVSSDFDPYVGMEQEYTLFKKDKTPLGWPEHGNPEPQGPYYCGVGTDEVFARDLVEDHTDACIMAGIKICGTNAEVMPGQWEYQVGYRDIDGESADPLTISDEIWLSRWLLYRITEDYNVIVSLDAKPIKGDWNGAGMHTNFSTKQTRNPSTGMAAIKKAVTALESNHKAHIDNYGYGLEDRLTGDHETCSIDDFRSGVGDRGSSIRIPLHVSEAGYGYFEDRRPAANANPYEVCIKLIETVCLND